MGDTTPSRQYIPRGQGIGCSKEIEGSCSEAVGAPSSDWWCSYSKKSSSASPNLSTRSTASRILTRSSFATGRAAKSLSSAAAFRSLNVAKLSM